MVELGGELQLSNLHLQPYVIPGLANYLPVRYPHSKAHKHLKLNLLPSSLTDEGKTFS